MGTGPSDIAVLSDAFRVAEYDTYFLSHPPLLPPAGHEKEPIVVDRHVVLVKNRWLYPIVSLHETGEGRHVPFEARIDEEGVVVRPSGGGSPMAPIPERSDIFTCDPDHPFEIAFPKVDAEGRALMVRLFLSPFRLPKRALERLCSNEFKFGLRKHIPSLWEWTKPAVSPAIPSTEPTMMTTSDGWVLKERRTTMTLDGKATRVWIGVDPFHVARRRSDLYVKAREDYVKVFEPQGGSARKHWEKMQFLKLLDEAIANNAKVPGRYRGALGEKRVTDEIIEYREQEKTARLRFSDQIKALIEVLESPFFAVLQYASIEEEGYEGAEYSEALVEHIDLLNHVLRRFDECAEGIMLLTRWIDDAGKGEHHFLNQFVFPLGPCSSTSFEACVGFPRGPWASSRPSTRRSSHTSSIRQTMSRMLSSTSVSSLRRIWPRRWSKTGFSTSRSSKRA